VSSSYSPSLYGWQALTGFDTYEQKVIVQDSPFERGDAGFIQVIYVSGYATIPDDLIETCLLMAEHLMSGGYFPTEGVSAEGSILPLWLPKDVEKNLQKYKRVI
jgi:hypothetical protein